MASALRPEGRLILAASHIIPFPAAQPTSLVCCMVKCQVRFPLAAGRVEGFVASSAPIMVTVLSLFAARDSLLISAAVNTAIGFCKSPEPYTIISDGAVM